MDVTSTQNITSLAVGSLTLVEPAVGKQIHTVFATGVQSTVLGSAIIKLMSTYSGDGDQINVEIGFAAVANTNLNVIVKDQNGLDLLSVTSDGTGIGVRSSFVFNGTWKLIEAEWLD